MVSTPDNGYCCPQYKDVVATTDWTQTDPDLSLDSTDCKPLHVAVYWGQLEIATRLLDAGANIERSGSTRTTPLSIAIWDSKLEMVLLLLKRGASILNLGKFMLAVNRYNLNWEIVWVLFQFGVDSDWVPQLNDLSNYPPAIIRKTRDQVYFGSSLTRRLLLFLD